MQFNQFCFFDVKVLCYLQVLKNTKFVQIVLGVIYIVRPHKGGGEGSSQMRTTAYKGGGGVQGCVRTQKKIFFWTTKSQNFSFFVQKKLLHCHLLLCIEKCKPALSYK